MTSTRLPNISISYITILAPSPMLSALMVLHAGVQCLEWQSSCTLAWNVLAQTPAQTPSHYDQLF